MTTPYRIDADMLGPEFTGSLSDLADFVEILAEETGRPETDFVLQQHVGQDPETEEPSEVEWNSALVQFSEKHPELFGNQDETESVPSVTNEVHSVVIKFQAGSWAWMAYRQDGTVVYGGHIKTRAKAPTKAQLVNKLPSSVRFSAHAPFIMPVLALNYKNWTKVRGESSYVWTRPATPCADWYVDQEGDDWMVFDGNDVARGSYSEKEDAEADLAQRQRR